MREEADKRGQTWEERLSQDRSFVFLILDVVQLSGNASRSYRLLDLETGNIDHVACSAIDLPDKWWRRLA